MVVLFFTAKSVGYRVSTHTTVMAILYILYQTYVFFVRMYRVSKWTSEIARFMRTLLSSFWAMELTVFAAFTYLLTFRSLMPRYGFNHAEAVVAESLTTSTAADEFSSSALLILLLLSMPILKKVKKPQVLTAALTHATIIMFSTFVMEYTATLAAFTWLRDSQVMVANATRIDNWATQLTGTALSAKLTDGCAVLTSAETMHEADTSIFYNIIMVALKFTHTTLVLLGFLAALAAQLRAGKVSWELLASLSVNALFLTAFSGLAYIPGMLELCSPLLAFQAQNYEAKPNDTTTQLFIVATTGLGS